MKSNILQPNNFFKSRYGLYKVQSEYVRGGNLGKISPVSPASARINNTNQQGIILANAGGGFLGNLAITFGGTLQKGDLLLLPLWSSFGITNGSGITGKDVSAIITDDAGHIWNRAGHSFIDTGNYAVPGLETNRPNAAQFTHEIFWTFYNGNPITNINLTSANVPNSFDAGGAVVCAAFRPGRAPVQCVMTTFNSGALGDNSVVYDGTHGTNNPIQSPALRNTNRYAIASYICPNTGFLLNDGSTNMGGVVLTSTWYLLEAIPAGGIGTFTPGLNNLNANKAPFWLMSNLIF